MCWGQQVGRFSEKRPPPWCFREAPHAPSSRGWGAVWKDGQVCSDGSAPAAASASTAGGGRPEAEVWGRGRPHSQDLGAPWEAGLGSRSQTPGHRPGEQGWQAPGPVARAAGTPRGATHSCSAQIQHLRRRRAGHHFCDFRAVGGPAGWAERWGRGPRGTFSVLHVDSIMSPGQEGALDLGRFRGRRM